MPITRRDVLFGLGGGLAGAALTPVPWKLLDDTAIWTQRRHALPVPPRGAVSVRPAACTLCPAGCAVRVRSVGARPVAVTGEPKHPLGGGACALGLTLHHLAYHPLRLTGPAVRENGRLLPIAPEAAVARVADSVEAARKAGRSVALLDRRPGRVVSSAWQELLGTLPHGLYVTHSGEGETLAVLQAALEHPSPLGIDLDRTRTLVSFGAPVLEGWGRPGRMLAARGGLRVVQIDTWRSPSAALADEWVEVAPGGEGALALALAHALLRDDPGRAGADVRSTLAGFSPIRVAARAGVAADRIESLALALATQAPVVAIGGGDPGAGPLPVDTERAIALLNVVLGSVGREGGIVPRRPLPEARTHAVGATTATLEGVPGGSVGVLLLDGADDGRALPWPALRRVLAKDALVVSLSPFDGALAAEAGLLVPGAAPLEAWDEVLPTAGASVASYAVCSPILKAPEGATDPVALAHRLGAALGVDVAATTHEERLRERVAAIHAARCGRLLARENGGYAEQRPGDADAMWKTLVAGGCWIDAPQPVALALPRPPVPSSAALEGWARPAAEESLALVAFAARGTAGTTPVSPLLSKLYQESNLRPAATTVAMSPRTAEGLGLANRQPVRVESAAGAVAAELRIDPTLPPGRVALAAGPDPAALHPGATTAARGALPLAVAAADGTWRGTRVRVREA
jgi:anaerobic selenocysteine-containing dehydrogenase